MQKLIDQDRSEQNVTRVHKSVGEDPRTWICHRTQEVDILTATPHHILTAYKFYLSQQLVSLQ